MNPTSHTSWFIGFVIPRRLPDLEARVVDAMARRLGRYRWQVPPGRLFRELRRSAVRDLIRARVGEFTAMKASGRKTHRMLDRYNIIEDVETAAALVCVDERLSTQPRLRKVEEAQFGNTHIAAPRARRPSSTT